MSTPSNVEINDIGLTHFRTTTDGPYLTDELDRRGVAHQRIDVPHLVGMAGCASVVHYTNAESGRAVAVLVVPTRGEDWFAEDYYYFVGMPLEDALRDEQAWIDRYDAARSLVR